MDAYDMDDVDRRLLDIIQTAFPLSSHPYAELGEQTGITEDEALRRVNAMRAARIIRRMGANFQSSRLGWVSTLCAAKVPEDRMEAFTAVVNACPGVTHNYVRAHAYNIWFTLISPSREQEAATLAAMERETGIAVLNLPATRLFKIRVDFRMKNDDAAREDA